MINAGKKQLQESIKCTRNTRKKQRKLKVIYFTLFSLQHFDLTLGHVLGTLYSVGLLQMSDQPDAETST
jgi:hypothetical protein